MKLLLIQSLTDSPEGPIFPLGLAYLAAALPPDWNPRVVDMNVERDPYGAIAAAGRAHGPDLLGLSVRNIKVARPGEHITSGLEVRAMVQRIRAAVPGVPLLAGGAGFSLYADPLLRRAPEIDWGLVGEGEVALPAFLRQFPDPRGVAGLAYRDGARIVMQGRTAKPDFAALPWPRRDLFDMSVYRRYPTGVGVMTKRGCPYHCIHCSDIYLLGRRVRARPPADIIEELRFLKREYALTDFMFADQTFNVPADQTKELLRLLAQSSLGLRWTAYFTPDGLDAEMVDLFKRSGCQMLGFSPDCCSDDMLRALGRGFTMADLQRANRLIRQARIPVTYNFMLGLPGETLGSLARTLAFVVRSKLELGRLLQLHGLFMVPARIYPHTVLRKMAVRARAISAGDDLLEARFSRARSRIANWADRAVMSSLAAAWKLKHRLRPGRAAPGAP